MYCTLHGPGPAQALQSQRAQTNPNYTNLHEGDEAQIRLNGR